MTLYALVNEQTESKRVYNPPFFPLTNEIVPARFYLVSSDKKTAEDYARYSREVANQKMPDQVKELSGLGTLRYIVGTIMVESYDLDSLTFATSFVWARSIQDVVAHKKTLTEEAVKGFVVPGLYLPKEMGGLVY